MTENDLQSVQRLKGMLGDESTASLSEVLGVITKLLRCEESAESLKNVAPVDVLHGYFSARDVLWGIPEHYFWSLNNKVSGGDFTDYFRCIEALPSVAMAGNVMRLMVWGIGGEGQEETLAAFSRQIPSFLSNGKWNGGKSVFLAMRGAIDCVDHRQEGQTSVVLSIVRSRTGLERIVAATAAISLVVRALSGNLDEEDGWRDTPRHSREIQLLDLYKTLKKENEELLKGISFSLIVAVLFGLNIELDWKSTEKFRNAGLPVEGQMFSYAEALIVASACGIVLLRDECVKSCTLALFCADRSHMWRQKILKSDSLFMADLIAGFDDVGAVWKDIRMNAKHLLYRGLHEYHTGKTVSLSDRMEVFVGTAFLLTCDLCNKDRKREAEMVWVPAWSECVTALYALTLTNGFIPLIQYFFVKAGLCFTNESEIVPSGRELLKQLPLVELMPDKCVDCAEECLRALRANLDDVASLRIQEKDPELWKLVNSNTPVVSCADCART